MSEAAANLVARTDKVLSGLEGDAIAAMNLALTNSYLQLEKQLLAAYPNYTAAAQPNLLANQRALLLFDELKTVLNASSMDAVKPALEKTYQKVMSAASEEGLTLSDELMKLRGGDSFVTSTAKIPIEVIGQAAKNAAELVVGKDEIFKRDARYLITQGLAMGVGGRKVAGQLRQRLGVAKGRAEGIARTEINRAQNEAAKANYKANGLEYFQSFATSDGRLCPYCGDRNGNVYQLDAGSIPWHVRCLVPGTTVSAPLVKATTHRQYRGEVVTIKTAAGNHLTVTPNHPILTPQGWVAAGLLNEGRDVFSSAQAERVVEFAAPDKYNAPTLIEEVVASFNKADGVLSVGVEVSAVDFHGDGEGSEVCVVSANSKLGSEADSDLKKHFLKRFFKGRNVRQGALPRNSSFAFLVPRCNSASSSLMRGFDLMRSLLIGHLSPLQSFSLGRAANRCLGVFKNGSDGSSVQLESFGKRILGLSQYVSSDDISPHRSVALPETLSDLCPVHSPVLGVGAPEPSFLEDSPERMRVEMDSLRSVFDRFAGEISRDRIVEFSRSHYEGPVYNLETETGWYFAENILTHNCRCYAAPWSPAWEDEGLTSDKWMKDFHDEGLALLEKQGGRPNKGPTYFEKKAGMTTAPKPIWSAGKGYLVDKAKLLAQDASVIAAKKAEEAIAKKAEEAIAKKADEALKAAEAKAEKAAATKAEKALKADEAKANKATEAAAKKAEKALKAAEAKAKKAAEAAEKKAEKASKAAGAGSKKAIAGKGLKSHDETFEYNGNPDEIGLKSTSDADYEKQIAAYEKKSLAQLKGYGLTDKDAKNALAGIHDWTDAGSYKLREMSMKGESNAKLDGLEAMFEKVPGYDGPLYRGANFATEKEYESFLKEFETGGQTAAIGSFSSSVKVATNYSLDGEKIKAVVAVKGNKSGVSINNLAYHGPEQFEVLVPKGVQYKLVSVEEVKIGKDTVRKITVEEIGKANLSKQEQAKKLADKAKNEAKAQKALEATVKKLEKAAETAEAKLQKAMKANASPEKTAKLLEDYAKKKATVENAKKSPEEKAEESKAKAKKEKEEAIAEKTKRSTEVKAEKAAKAVKAAEEAKRSAEVKAEKAAKAVKAAEEAERFAEIKAETIAKALSTATPSTQKPGRQQLLFPTDLDGLEEVGGLGGSTGAKLVRDPKTGKQYVLKRGGSEGHLREEISADMAYQALGVAVPKFKLYETADGPVKLAEFIEGKPLSALSGKAKESALKKLRKDFAVDALLGNWDVVGLSGDNVLVDGKGNVYRIDNGGSLRYRAQGAKKKDAWNNYPQELWTLRDRAVNEQTADAFGELSISDIAKQIDRIGKKQEKLLAALPAELHGTISNRLDELMQTAYVAKVFKADKFKDDYTDGFAKHGMGIRAAGITDRLPERLEQKSEGSVIVVDENGNKFDHLRGKDSIIKDLQRYIDSQGGSYKTMEYWMDAQAGDSWSDNSKALKWYLANQREVSKDAFWWKDGKNDAKDYYDFIAERAGGESVHDTSIQAFHAFNYEMVRNVKFNNRDEKTETIQLMRTENLEVMKINRLKEGDKNIKIKRGVAESTSIFKEVTVFGSEMTVQNVPWHRVIGSYFHERGPESGDSAFLGDRENEFVVMLEDIPFDYVSGPPKTIKTLESKSSSSKKSASQKPGVNQDDDGSDVDFDFSWLEELEKINGGKKLF